MHAWHDVELGVHIERHFRAVIQIPRRSSTSSTSARGCCGSTGCSTAPCTIQRTTASCRAPSAAMTTLSTCSRSARSQWCRCACLRARAIGRRQRPGRPEYAHYRDIAGLPPHRVKELQRFFLDYKVLEDQAVNVEHLRGHAEALQVIRDAVRLYGERIAPTRPGGV